MIVESAPKYSGRFAPSPTGSLHFGSLVAALASYADARSAGGQWLVRMEDMDLPRCVPGAAGEILSCLDAYGFEWDEEVVYQSRRQDLYRDALHRLGNKVYPCACSRKDTGGRYPNTCRDGLRGRPARTLRYRAPDGDIEFVDHIQGLYRENVQATSGDFIVHRVDGLYAYQLAVVVDDAAQGITDIVRGADLLDSTPRQLVLYADLQLAPARYAHVPTALNIRGDKLSKQTHAPPIPQTGDPETLAAACAFLGHEPPADLLGSPIRDLWSWVIAHWDLRRIPHIRSNRTGVL